MTNDQGAELATRRIRRVAGRMFPLLAATTMATAAAAHDWYPWDCCSGLDCAPVDAAEVLPGAALRVRTRHGETVIPPDFVRRPSLDGRMHACMRPAEQGHPVPICLFVPPGT
jgi:hypothetical protein